jgi:hypothetical protein
MRLLRRGRPGGRSPSTFPGSRGGGWRRRSIPCRHRINPPRTPMSDRRETGDCLVGRTVHSSTRLISSVGALRRLWRPLLRGGSRLLKGMLGRLLILGRGRGKTRTTTSLVGHHPAEEVAGAMSQCWRGRLGRTRVWWRASDVRRDRLDAMRFQLVPQETDFRFVAGTRNGNGSETEEPDLSMG